MTRSQWCRSSYQTVCPPVYLASATVAGTYLLMILGAYTSAIGAGLSCPDWPACYGAVVPFVHPDSIADSPHSALRIFVERAHRGLATVVGVLVVSTALVAWSARSWAIVVGPAVHAAVLLPVQVALGGLTVTESLEPVIVTTHPATGMLILMSVTATTVGNWLLQGQRAPGN